MENAERLVNKTAEIHEFASEVARMIRVSMRLTVHRMMVI